MHLRSLHALTDLLFSIFCLSVSYNYRIFNIELRILFVRITCSLYIYTLHILRITTSLYRVSIYLYVFSSRYIERVYCTPFYVCFSRFHFWINNDSRFESGCLFYSGSCVVGILRNRPIEEPPVRRSNKNRTIGSPFSIRQTHASSFSVFPPTRSLLSCADNTNNWETDRESD